MGESDRFIPSRATSNFNFSLWENSPARDLPAAAVHTPTGANCDGDNNDSNSDDRSDEMEIETSAPRINDATGGPQHSMLNVLLRSELLGENIDPAASTNVVTPYHPGSRGSHRVQPLREGGNHFRFQSPRQAYHNAMVDQMTPTGTIVSSFDLAPVGSATSQRILSTPQKRKRRIQKVPFKVLDAPALQDDFYLNLVDW
jgi:hypothetical protein